MADSEQKRRARKWRAWAVCEPDGSLHDIRIGGPNYNESLRKLIEMGWSAVPVQVKEILEV